MITTSDDKLTHRKRISNPNFEVEQEPYNRGPDDGDQTAAFPDQITVISTETHVTILESDNVSETSHQSRYQPRSSVQDHVVTTTVKMGRLDQRRPNKEPTKFHFSPKLTVEQAAHRRQHRSADDRYCTQDEQEDRSCFKRRKTRSKRN